SRASTVESAFQEAASAGGAFGSRELKRDSTFGDVESAGRNLGGREVSEPMGCCGNSGKEGKSAPGNSSSLRNRCRNLYQRSRAIQPQPVPRRHRPPDPRAVDDGGPGGLA